MPHWLGPLAAFGASVTWAIASGVYTRLALERSPFAVNFARAWISLPFLLVITVFSGSGLGGELSRVAPAHLAWFSLATIASYGVGDILFMHAAGRIGFTPALAVASAYPVWSALAGWFLNGEALGWLQLCGLGLSVAGTAGVIATREVRAGEAATAGRREAGRMARGVGMAVVASLLWALNAVAMSKGGVGVLPTTGTMLRNLTSLVFLAVASGITSRPLLLAPASLRRFWPVFAFESVFGSISYLYGMTHSTLAVGAVMSSLAPVLSVPVAFLLGFERFSLSRTAWIAAVVAGVSLLAARA